MSWIYWVMRHRSRNGLGIKMSRSLVAPGQIHTVTNELLGHLIFRSFCKAILVAVDDDEVIIGIIAGLF